MRFIQASPGFARAPALIVVTLLALSRSAVVQPSVHVDPRAVVKQALEDLEKGTEHDRYWATVKLGRYPDHALHGLPILVRALNDPAPRVRSGAAVALEYFGERASKPWVVRGLLGALSDSQPEVRAAAAFALGEIGLRRRSALAPLVECVDTVIPELQVGCGFALKSLFPSEAPRYFAEERLSQRAIGLLEVALGNEDGLRTVRFANAAAFLSPEVAAGTVDSLAERYFSGTYNARYALESYRPHLNWRVSRWKWALDAPSVDVRVAAARVLGLLGVKNPVTIARLRERLQDVERVAVASAGALADIGVAASPAIPELSALLRSPSHPLREAAAMALISISPTAAEQAAATIRLTDPELAGLIKAVLQLSML